MADPTGDPATRDRPGTPRWVKVLGIAALVLALLVIVVMLVSGGQHGPGMHATSSDVGGQTPSSSGPESAYGVGGPAAAHEFTFGDAGALDDGYHEAGNYEAGMRGQITVS
ncbi:MAG: hypothetical protein ABIZ34_08105 [Candidatus Limnocylindrales bacterium]